MRNQNGVTMVSLVIYVFAFVIIIGIVGAVTTFFSNNVGGLNESAGKNAEYNKFNIYMSNYTKNGYSVFLGNDDEENYTRPYMIFEKDDEQIVVEKIDDVLYVDNAKLCDKVEEFEADKTTTDNGQDVLRTKININGTVYTNDYILEEGRVADDEDQFDNSESLVLGFVDDTGTNSIIYLYNNVEKITSGTITITMPDSTTSTITAIADTSNISNTSNYAGYTVSKNGVYEFQATSGTTTTTTKIRVKNIEKFTDVSTLGLDYAKNDQSAYNYNGAAIPNGYYVDTKSKVSTGLVITDEIDSEGYSTGNEWVWVPVNESVGNNEFYINGSGTVAGTNVTYTKYSKLWSFATNSETGVTTRTDLSNPQVQPSSTSTSATAYREPAILTNTSYGEVTYYNQINKRGSENKFTNVEEVATQYITDYNNMVESVNKYGGFFMGRYEITANGEKRGNPLTSTNWYTYYNKCMTYGKENTESGMIYGNLWDATMQWLAKSGYGVGYTGKNYIGYGNYAAEEVKINNKDTAIILKAAGISQKMYTGRTSYTSANNIYDLAGNCADWTQEATNDYRRVCRGWYNQGTSTSYCYTSYRNYSNPNYTASYYTSRPCLYIKTNNEQPIDNSQSLVSALVDDLGTRSTIYLYNNTNKITSGTITVTMPNGTTKDITALADTSSISNTANYATYTVAQNGTYKFQATDGTNTTTTTVEVKNIERFTDVSLMGLAYCNNENKAYNYNGAAVPVGYYVDTRSDVNTGLVITDAVDNNGYSIGNEWVWVPVNSTVGNNDFYLTGEGTVVGTTVPYTKYSKLWQFTTDSETGVTTRTDLSNPQVQPSAGSGIREPVILTSQTYGEVVKYNLINDRKTGNAFENVEGVATQYVTDFNNMCDSVDKYGGFYIGRYELTANGEKPGSAIQQILWVDAYNQSMMLGKEYTETGMIYDTLWDATACWLSKSGYNVGVSIDNYIAYGNCRFEQVSVSNELVKIILKSSGSPAVFKTGQLSYSKTNNIFDLNGNMGERTQGSEGYYYKVTRGGNYNSTIASGYITYRSHGYLTDRAWTTGSRPCLYIK